MSDFLREVDEDYRRDQMVQLWKRFGPWVLMATGLVIIGVAVGVYWRDHKLAEASRQTDLYIDALADFTANKADQGLAKLKELEADGGAGMEALALMTRAQKLIEAGKREESVETYEALAASDRTPEPLRSFATLQIVALQLDSMPADEVRERLKTMAVPGHVWYGSASEAIGLAMLREGRGEDARSYLEFLLSDGDVPEPMRQRVAAYLQMIGPRPKTELAPAAASEKPAAASDAPADAPVDAPVDVPAASDAKKSGETQ